MTQHITRQVRATAMHLLNFNRSLELCARMNYETENLDFIDSLPKGAVLYDLGACEGRFAIYAALNQIHCYAFEPEQNNFAALQQNCTLNQLDDSPCLTLFNKAVGATSHQAILSIGQPWAGGHLKVVESAVGRQDLKFDVQQTQTITVVALDEWIAQQQLPWPEFLKVDVDGSEWDFVCGAQQVLSSETLQAVLFELSTEDTQFDAVIQQLQQYGLQEQARFAIPNETTLFNFLFVKPFCQINFGSRA